MTNQVNDEAPAFAKALRRGRRMTNNETSSNAEETTRRFNALFSSFGIRHSFDIRHSTFVI
jgi:hypothetical protein